MDSNGIIILIVFLIIEIVVGAIVVYFVNRSLADKFHREQENKADNVLKLANEKSRSIELEAKDKSIKVLQEAEAELSRRRQDLAREEERLTKRRTELDNRIERLEQRE